nr:MAG TPA: hypothetical protein [Caudoviricetes sp.]
MRNRMKYMPNHGKQRESVYRLLQKVYIRTF